MTTAPYKRPDYMVIPPRGEHICPKCRIPCEVMPIETPDGPAKITMCCHVKVESG